MNEDNLIYSILPNNYNNSKIKQYLITLSNYTIYKYKIMKFYNVVTEVSEQQILNTFILKLKYRVASDHKRFNFLDFIDIWDPGENHKWSSYNKKEIINWQFIRC